MKTYDAVVVGSGCGMIAADEAVGHGLRVAVIDRGPLGGTCPNLGCIPSKLLIFAADRVMEVREASRFGISVGEPKVDFSYVMDSMRRNLQDNQEEMRHSLSRQKGLDFYEGQGHFVADYTLEVDGKQIMGNRIFIAAGSRPFTPPIKGLDSIDFLTNENALQLTEKPESLIIIGGGYIAVEYGHFFAAMGTRVTIVEMADRLLTAEEPEISTLLKEEMGKRMQIVLNAQAEEITKDGDKITVLVKDRKTGVAGKYSASKLMVAVGRRSNADLLKVESTGVKLDEKGFIQVDGRMATSKKDIFAVGDINGRQMFTHMANRQALLAAHDVLHNADLAIDFTMPPPHAVFAYPQIAAVGMTEVQARENHKVMVGRADYWDVAAGQAMHEEKAFAKAIVEQETEKILGFHIIGPHASLLIQEVIDAMAAGGQMDYIRSATHIHPALPEIIPRALANVQ